MLSEARRRRGGLVPGMTSILRCFLISCFSSAPLVKVIRLRLANSSLARAEPRGGHQDPGGRVVVGHDPGQRVDGFQAY